MAGPWENVQLPAPPSLMPPKADFSALGELGTAYYTGQQQQRTQAIQNAFQGGLPIDPATGQVDYKAAAQTYLRLGAPDQAVNMLQLDYYSRPEKKVTDPNSPEGQAALLRGQGAPQLGAAQPAMPAATPPRQTTSPTGYSGGDNGQNTVASFVTDALGNVPVLGRAIVSVARSLGVDPNQPLTAEQQQKLAPVIARISGGQQPAGGSMQPQPVPAEEQTAQGGPGGLLLPQARAQPPQTAQAQPAQAPPAQAQPQQRAPLTQLQSWQGPTPADALMPDVLRGRVSPQSFRDHLLQQAAEQRDAAKVAGDKATALKIKLDTAPMLAKAAEWEAQAKDINAALAPTEMQKNLSTRAPEQEIVQKKGAERSEALYNGIAAASRQYQKEGSQFNNLAKSTLSQPETYTGIGANGVLDLNKIRAIYGDQKAAQYQELINKLSSANVLSQITNVKLEGSEGGQTGGKIFAQQVALAEKAAVQTTGTLAGMRTLTEIQGRMGDYSVRLHHLANDYYKQHGKLDAGFDDKVEADMAAHPLFSKSEQQNPSLLGAPTSPFTNIGQTATWAQKMGLKPGEPIRTQDGRLTHVPRVNSNGEVVDANGKVIPLKAGGR